MKITNNSDSKLDYSNQYIRLIIEELCAKYDFDGDISFKFYYAGNDKKCDLESGQDVLIIQRELNNRLDLYNKSKEDNFDINEELINELSKREDVRRNMEEHTLDISNVKNTSETHSVDVVDLNSGKRRDVIRAVTEYLTNTKTSQYRALRTLEQLRPL